MDNLKKSRNRLAMGRARTLFTVAALFFVLASLAIISFADRLGIDEETAHLLGIIFTVVALSDYLILRFWDRLFNTKPGEGRDS